MYINFYCFAFQTEKPSSSSCFVVRLFFFAACISSPSFVVPLHFRLSPFTSSSSTAAILYCCRPPLFLQQHFLLLHQKAVVVVVVYIYRKSPENSPIRFSYRNSREVGDCQSSGKQKNRPKHFTPARILNGQYSHLLHFSLLFGFFSYIYFFLGTKPTHHVLGYSVLFTYFFYSPFVFIKLLYIYIFTANYTITYIATRPPTLFNPIYVISWHEISSTLCVCRAIYPIINHLFCCTHVHTIPRHARTFLSL